MLGRQDGAGESVAARLLAARRILPVLDGLDEVTESLRGEAVTRINAGVRPGDKYLLTSRPREFRDAVEASDVLTAAATVRLEALTIDDLDRYLPLTTRKGRGAGTKWHPVLEHTRRSAVDSALFEVLSTPLMVALAGRCSATPTQIRRHCLLWTVRILGPHARCSKICCSPDSSLLCTPIRSGAPVRTG
ncbi:hypothetical protein [Amycolatopsis sp. NPDC004625]|uniref:hypothetical protein n=1 Tax=Amycolatopsis sp. NPDC004625 TaxID=3154670 RepID=UPI0033A8724F